MKKLREKSKLNQADCAKGFGISPSSWSLMEGGKWKFAPDDLFKIAAFFGVDPGWLLTGREADVVSLEPLRLPPVTDIPGPEGRRMSFAGEEMPVRGLAAGDDSGGTRIPDTDEMGEPIRFPSGLIGVPVVGESMSPVILGGQYVEIDTDREGFEKDDGIYVVSILEPGPDDDYPEPITGTFIKRCERRENMYYLKSINSFSPFSANVDHCRIWPVLGIWFGGKGAPPEGF